MKILILSWRGPDHPNAGGAEVSTHEHAKGWVRAGHQVTLFTSYHRGSKREDIIDGVIIKRYGRQMLGVQVEAFKWYLFKQHQKFDVVIDQFHGIPFFTPLYVREKKLGFIHEVAKEVWRLNPWPKPYYYFPAIFGGIFEPLIFLFYRHIPFMTVSNSTKQDLISWGIPAGKITVVENGVTIPDQVKPFPKEKEKTLIFLGALSRDKGIEDALRVFSILSKQENWKFWVVGKAEENYLAKLNRTAKEMGIDKKLTFFGFVNEKKKFELLSRAHLLTNTSVREGWGLVVIEAAAMRTPAVGYDVPGLRDSIVNNKTGLLCQPNPDACAREILSLMVDQKKYGRFQENCFKWSRRFNWRKASAKSLSLIKSII